MIDDMTRNIFKQYLLATNADPDRVYETLEKFRISATSDTVGLHSGNELFTMMIMFYFTESSRQVILDLLSEVKTIKRGN